MDVIRDFASVDYAAFFFIAFNVCRYPGSRLLLQRTLIVALVCAIFVSPNVNKYQIADALQLALQSADLRHKIGAADRRVAELNFDKPVIRTRLREIIDSLLPRENLAAGKPFYASKG